MNLQLQDVMSQRASLNNKHIGIINSRQLIEYNIQIPTIQRIRDDSKVREIVEYQQAKPKEDGVCNFLGVINVHYCEENKNLYLIDGQHRYEAVKIINENINIPVMIELVIVKSMSQLKENYKILNMNTPLPEFRSNEKDVPKSINNTDEEVVPMSMKNNESEDGTEQEWNEDESISEVELHHERHTDTATFDFVGMTSILFDEPIIPSMDESQEKDVGDATDDAQPGVKRHRTITFNHPFTKGVLLIYYLNLFLVLGTSQPLFYWSQSKQLTLLYICHRELHPGNVTCCISHGRRR